MKLRMIALVGPIFCVLLIASAMLEGNFVIRSFRATDALFANLQQTLEQQGAAAHCQDLQTGHSLDEPLNDPTKSLIPIPHASVSNELSMPCLGQQARLDTLRHESQILQTNRLSWQSITYKMMLVTSNLAALMLILAIVLSILYLNTEASAVTRVARARRAVLQTERRHAGLLAAAGHDLRQPLQALRLFLSVLLQRPLDAESRAIGLKIDIAAASMQRMIGSLVDIAKLDAGLVAADWCDVPLTRLFQSFAGEFEQLADASGLTFSIDRTAVVVHTDPDLLERILRNLIGNALKYTRKGGVTVCVQHVQRRVTIAVKDTGVGIPPERLDAVFNDFYRVEPSGSEGLGLGLGIVRRLSVLLDAPVHVTSTPNVGSIFSLDIPLSARQGLVENLASPAGPALPMPRVTALVVDDNEGVRGALKTQLAQWDMQVLEAGDYCQAWALAGETQPAGIGLIITDYDLGDNNGLHLLQELERVNGQRPHALIITGTSSEEVWSQLRHSGYVCLQKPIDSNRLEQEVRRLRANATLQDQR